MKPKKRLMVNKKIKVVWILRVMNQELAQRTPLSKTRMLNLIRRVTNNLEVLPSRDFCGWGNAMIKEFEKNDDVELHIIAPQWGLMELSHEFDMNGIHYHFIRTDLPFGISEVLEHLLPEQQRFRLLRYQVKKMIEKINPDIVHQLGIENPNMSYAVMDIADRPLFVTINTILNNPMREQFKSSIKPYRKRRELEMLAKIRYFGLANRMWRDLVVQYNPNAVELKFALPLEIPDVEQVATEHDFVFYASYLTHKKGFTDVVKALALVRDEFPEVKLNIIGNANRERDVYEQTVQYIRDNDLQTNITFTPPIPSYADLLQQVKKASVAVLPIKMDAISGTVYESMYIGVPVITYKTTGTPLLNRDKECVLLTEMENVAQLAQNMKLLLHSPDKAKQLGQNAKEYMDENMNNDKLMSRIVEQYHAIITNHKDGTPIPKHLHFELHEE